MSDASEREVAPGARPIDGDAATGDAPRTAPPSPALEPADDRPTAGPLRRGLLRGVLLGLACGVGGVLALGMMGSGEWLVILVFTTLVGVMAAPAFAVEHRVGPGGRGRHAAAGALTALLAAVGAYAAFLQSCYVQGALKGGGAFEGGLAGLTDALERTLDHLGQVVPFFGSFGVPFGVLTLVRLRGLRLPAQLAAAIAAWALLAGALALFLGGSRGDLRFVWLLTAVESLALPPLSMAADALERRLWPPDGAP